MKWKIHSKNKDSITYKQVKKDAYVVITIDKDLIEQIKNEKKM